MGLRRPDEEDAASDADSAKDNSESSVGEGDRGRQSTPVPSWIAAIATSNCDRAVNKVTEPSSESGGSDDSDADSDSDSDGGDRGNDGSSTRSDMDEGGG